MIMQYIMNSFEYKLLSVRSAGFKYSMKSPLYIWELTYTAGIGWTQNFVLKILRLTYMLDWFLCRNLQVIHISIENLSG